MPLCLSRCKRGYQGVEARAVTQTLFSMTFSIWKKDLENRYAFSVRKCVQASFGVGLFRSRSALSLKGSPVLWRLGR
jgi:ABC-type microcin C transport system permease subunit YejB